jgi:hypothetical protein
MIPGKNGSLSQIAEKEWLDEGFDKEMESLFPRKNVYGLGAYLAG